MKTFHRYEKKDYLNMLSDISRNKFYQEIIQNSKPKRVLDFGCGYPILSYYCLLSGAEKVYAIDNNADLVPVLEEFKSHYPDRFEYFITDHINLPDVEIDTVVYELFAPNLFHENIYTISNSIKTKYGEIDFLPSQWNLSVSICSIDQVERGNKVFGVPDKFNWLHDKWKITKGPLHAKFMYPINSKDWNFDCTNWYSLDQIYDTEWLFEFTLKQETDINLVYLKFKIKEGDHELAITQSTPSDHWGNQFITLPPRRVKGKVKVKVFLGEDKRHISADWVI